MITSDEEISLAYLLDPTFELVNSNGKPLTNGYIEVYIHGTRTKYYCASDFNGTLHPFKIPLDSLGANVVLASPAHTYDVYVYNAFDNLVLSRYNVTTVGFNTVIHHETVVTSEDDTVEVTSYEASGKTYFDLSVADTVDTLNNELTQKIETASADLLDKIDRNKEELNQKIDTASADLLDAIDRNKNEIMQNVESATATLQYEIETVSSRQVQSDWAETDDELPSYIKNKPEEQELIGGTNIELVETATAVKINCTLDTTPFATHTEVDTKVNAATAVLNNKIDQTKSTIEAEINSASSTLNNKIDQTKTEINSTINSVSSTINTRIDNVSSAFDAKLADKKDKQSPYSATGSQTKTLTQIIQNEQGVVSAVFSDIDLPPQVPSVNIISPNNTILVSATTNPQTNVKTFSIDVDEDHPQSNVQATTDWCNKVESSDNPVYATIYGDEYYLNNGKLYYKAGYHHVDQLVHVRYDGEPVNRLQRLRIMSTYDRETEHLFDMSYPHEDLITISSVDYVHYAVPYYFSVLYYGAGTATAWPAGFKYKVDIDMHSLKAPLAKSESGQATYQAGRGIDPTALAVDVIQVDSSIPDQSTVNATVATATSTLNTRINEVENEIPDVSNLATKNEVMTQVQAATAMIPDVSNFATEAEVMSQVQAATAMIPDTSDLATKSEVATEIQAVTAMIPDVSDFATHTELQTTVQAATALIPDVSDLATKNEVMTQVQAATAMIPDTSDLATKTEVMTQVQAATAMIPDPQVQSNWTETDTADPSYIQNKPTETILVPGQGISLNVQGGSATISSDIDTSNFATKSEVMTQVQAATAMIPDVSDLATKSEVMSQVQAATAMIPDTSAIEADISAISSTLTPIAEAINVDNFKVNASGQAFKLSQETVTEEVTQNIRNTTCRVIDGDPEHPLIDSLALMSQFDINRQYTIKLASANTLTMKLYALYPGNDNLYMQYASSWTNSAVTEITFNFNDIISNNDDRFTYVVNSLGATISAIQIFSDSTRIYKIYYNQESSVTVQSPYALQSEVNAKIQLVTALPANPDANVLYLIPEA